MKRADTVLMLVGPPAISIGAAAYGVLARGLPVGGAIVSAFALWQLSMVAVVLWGVFTRAG